MSQVYQYQGEVTNVNAKPGGKRVPAEANGHSPTPALTAAFSAAVTATLALIAAGRVWREK